MTRSARVVTEPAVELAGDEVAVIHTSKGDVRERLDCAGAPVTVANFVRLANEGFYDGTKFHRYVRGFVVQGGDPNTRSMSPSAVAHGLPGRDGMPGTGGPGYSIVHEYDRNPRNSHEDGAIAMARSQDPDSAGSQFYLCLGPQHALDSGYTVFGQPLEGSIAVISQLRAGDVIEGVDIVHDSQAL